MGMQDTHEKRAYESLKFLEDTPSSTNKGGMHFYSGRVSTCKLRHPDCTYYEPRSML